jgi:hypothetical protein
VGMTKGHDLSVGYCMQTVVYVCIYNMSHTYKSNCTKQSLFKYTIVDLLQISILILERGGRGQDPNSLRVGRCRGIPKAEPPADPK